MSKTKTEGAMIMDDEKPTEATGTALEIFDLAETAGGGLEDMRTEELLTPFLALIQPLSPQVDPASPLYIEVAKPGMLINTVTGQLYDGREGIEMVPCAREYLFGEWTPRDEGGGFHGSRGPDDPEVRKLIARYGIYKSLPTDRGTEFIEQFNIYAIVGAPQVTPENSERVVISFTSTKIKVYKILMGTIGSFKYPVQGKMIQPAMWAHRWRLSTVSQKNAKGSFWNFRFNLANGPRPYDSLIRPNEQLFQMGTEFNQLISSGRAQANYQAATQDKDEEVPF